MNARNPSIENLEEILLSLKGISVGLIGDAIVDEYVFCNPLNKTGKTGNVAFEPDRSEAYLGGVFAVANHLAEFVDNIRLITFEGGDSTKLFDTDYPNLLENTLNSRISRSFFSNGTATLTKTRYLNKADKNKVEFPICRPKRKIFLSNENEQQLMDEINDCLSDFDLVIAADFGNGLITRDIASYLSHLDKYLSVNCQTNSGNRGFNYITKYSRANFVSLNRSEIQLAYQDEDTPIRDLIQRLSGDLQGSRIIQTSGSTGSTYYDGENFYSANSIKNTNVDPVGAGDALFALTSLLTYKGVDPNLIPELGNTMGSISTGRLGNKKPIGPREVLDYLKSKQE